MSGFSICETLVIPLERSRGIVPTAPDLTQRTTTSPSNIYAPTEAPNLSAGPAVKANMGNLRSLDAKKG